MIAMPYQTSSLGTPAKVENVRNDVRSECSPHLPVHSPGLEGNSGRIVPISSPSSSNLVDNEDGIDDDGDGSDEGSSRGKGSKKIRKPRTIYRFLQKSKNILFHHIKYMI